MNASGIASPIARRLPIESCCDETSLRCGTMTDGYVCPGRPIRFAALSIMGELSGRRLPNLKASPLLNTNLRGEPLLLGGAAPKQLRFHRTFVQDIKIVTLKGGRPSFRAPGPAQ